MVYFPYFGKEPGVCKAVLVIVGLAQVSLTCHGYFNSAWVKRNVYEICQWDNKTQSGIDDQAPCPAIIFEKLFVGMSIFTVTLTILTLALNLITRDFSEGLFKLGDCIYNLLAGLLILISGSLFLYSTTAIDKLITAQDCENCKSAQLFTVKIIGGVLGLIESLLYFTTGVVLFYK